MTWKHFRLSPEDQHANPQASYGVDGQVQPFDLKPMTFGHNDDDNGDHIYYDLLGDDQLTSVTSPTMGMLKRRRQPWIWNEVQVIGTDKS